MKQLARDLARHVYRRLLPRRVKNTLRLWTMFEERDKPPELIETFPERSVLVLAPHMDDEVVGCGGTLRRHVLAGARVVVVFLTDGSGGNQDLYQQRLTDAELDRAEHALSSERKDESRRAAELLGYEEFVFLDQPDTRLDADDALTARLSDILQRYAPDLIYAPSPLESHLDHWAASRLLARAIARGGTWLRPETLCRNYEAWTPVLANRCVDITDVADLKFRALREFRSQLAHVDYEHVTRGLNAYRSLHRHGRGYFEAFHECTPEQHRALIEHFEQRR